MELKKFSPWNWFRKEQDQVPVSNARQGLAPINQSSSADPFYSMQQQINQMFDDFSRRFGMPSLTTPGAGLMGSESGFFRPSVDIKENRDQYQINVDLPGVNKDDVQVTLEQDALVIRGERHQERESDDDNYQFVERHYGSFQRVLDLPADADPDSLKAQYEDGVLKIRINRLEEARSPVKQIEVQ
ncbi:MAG: Hsp20/alpha crystallin family protein [Oleiphilaceae bacterium]|nr:Hsp20/alpha crystallin family protein [Oleiphilaceae bacterium]